MKEKLKQASLIILEKCKEKTTWLGVLSVAVFFGAKLTPSLQEAIIAVLVAIDSLVLTIIRPEDK